MKPPFKQRHPLFRPLAVITISILLLFSLSYFFVASSSKALSINTDLLKITSAQESLSQQIINTITANNLNTQIGDASLDNLIDSFTTLQNQLLNNNTILSISSSKKNLYDTYNQLNVTYKNFSSLLNENMIDVRNEKFVSLLQAQTIYLKKSDAFTNSLDDYSKNEIKDFKAEELSILCFSILLVLLEIWFIFLPAIKKIEKQNDVLREISFTQAHIIRRPLTNIQSLLNMTLEKKQDDYNMQLLTLAKKEADELDTAIKNNIYKSDKNYKLQK